MNEREILYKCRLLLNDADDKLNKGDHGAYSDRMGTLLDFLTIQLIGGASNETQTKIDNL